MSAILELRNVSKVFGGGLFDKNRTVAVEDVTFSIPSESPSMIAVAGESGSGKTTLSRLLLGVTGPSTGQVLYNGADMASLSKEGRKQFLRDVQPIYQDPFGVYNPFYKADHLLYVAIKKFKLASSTAETKQMIVDALETVGMRADEVLGRFPHQLSGGQRQRVSVARALTVEPKFIVADEAVSMVDVSIRVSLLNMLSRLKSEFDVTFLFITHDLALAKYFSWEGGRIIVMYLGRIVEEGPTSRVITDPRHPYTQALLAAVPEADPELAHKKRHIELRSAEIPSLLALPNGCTFHPRCPYFVPGECDSNAPQLERIPEGGSVACPVRKFESIELLGV